MRYKKLTLMMLSLIFLISVQPVLSQSQSAGVRFLPQAGLNFTKLTDDPINTTEKFRLGAEAGIWVQTKNPVFFQPGLFYAQQRLDELYVDELEDNLTTDTILNKLDYRCLKLPVMFGLQVLGARVYTGPSFTYIINMDDMELAEEQFKDLTMGLNVGAGINITMFSFDIRYEYGVTHVLQDNVAKTNILTVSAGLKF
ncbi:MAG: porin family protein [Bacteroidales bacterium]